MILRGAETALKLIALFVAEQIQSMTRALSEKSIKF